MKLQLPRDVDAERAVLGAVLVDSEECWPVVSDVLRPADFFDARHVEVWRACRELAKQSGSFDMLSLRGQLFTADRLERAGGDEYLMSLTDTIPTATSAARAAKRVQELAIVREVIRVAWSLAAEGGEPMPDVADYLERASTVLSQVCERRSGHVQATTLAEALDESYATIAKRQASGDALLGYATGFADLDRALGGLAAGDLIVLAARPGVGKSALANAIKLGVARSTNKQVLSLELEMNREQLSHRFLAAESGVPLSKIRAAKLDGYDLSTIAATAHELSQLPIVFVERRQTRISELRAQARRMVRLNGPMGLIVVDYLQIARPESRGNQREREIAEISAALKSLAGELHCPVLALSQLNRAVESRAGNDRRPRLSDLRESGAIEQDADTVLFIHREELIDRNTPDKGLAEIIIAKQRSGPIGTVRLRWVPELTRFESLTRREQQQPLHYGNGHSHPNYE